MVTSPLLPWVPEVYSSLLFGRGMPWGLGSRASQEWGEGRKQRALYFKHLAQLFHGDHLITI